MEADVLLQNLHAIGFTPSNVDETLPLSYQAVCVY